jgi:hypothetical protein
MGSKTLTPWRTCFAWAAACAVALPLIGRSVLAGPQSAGNRAHAPSRTASGQPDLQGIWEARNRAWGDLLDHDARPGLPAAKNQPFPTTWGVPAGPGVVEGGVIPYQPWALAKQKENFDNRMTRDPLAKCNMPGIPRATYLNLAFQIAQTPKYIAMMYEYSHTNRIIYMDGSPHVEGIEFWMGDSRGRWERDTLVVDVTNFNDQTWFDMAGNFHSEALHVVERYTRADRDRLEYEVTIEDSKVFTRPWKIRMPLYRVSVRDYGDRLLDYECAELAESAAGTFFPGISKQAR